MNYDPDDLRSSKPKRLTLGEALAVVGLVGLFVALFFITTSGP